MSSFHDPSVNNKESCFDDLTPNSIPELASFCEKNKIQNVEIQRLEKQNSEYRDQLLKAYRERDNYEELLKNNKAETDAKWNEFERKLLDYESQVKACKDRLTAEEQNHKKCLTETANKFNETINQITKKCEAAEKERNDAVIRYATREAEIMKLTDSRSKIVKELDTVREKLSQLEKSISMKNVDDLKQTISERQKELEAERLLKAEIETELKMALKRINAGQTALSELRDNLEQTQYRLAQETEERISLRNENRKLVHQLNELEQRQNEETLSSKRESTEKDGLYNTAASDSARLRERNVAISSQLESINQELVKLRSERDALSSQLEVVNAKYTESISRLQSLEFIIQQSKQTEERLKRAEIEMQQAAEERSQAEKEATSCRSQAERMLEITEKLATKNSALSSECETLRAKNLTLNTKVIELESELKKTQNRLCETGKELEHVKKSSAAEISSLKIELGDSLSKQHSLVQQLDEARNDREIIRRKNAASVKELRAELSSLRKAQINPVPDTSHCSFSVETNSIPNAVNDESSPSQASSTTSADAVNRYGQVSFTSIDEFTAPKVQKQMVEKIVKLQRELARRQDKIDFLEEHVRQCTDELKKKTRIIQNYALREEASLLLPNSDELGRFGMSKSNGTSLIGSFFMNNEKKADAALAAEVNSRLQAVLEDALQKNITLKNNIDTLGKEISRLSRENRQLVLTKQNV